MVLLTSSELSLTIANEKSFNVGELHVTRRNKKESILILMRKGTLRFYEDGIPIILKEGEFYIQKVGLLQEGMAVPVEEDDPASYYFIHFTGGTFAESGPGIPLRGKFHMSDVIAHLDTLMERKNINRFFMTAELYMIFSILASASPISEYSKKEDFLETVRNFLEASYSDKVTINDLASRFGYHPNHLAHLFMKRYQVTVRQYLIGVRMRRARWLLLNSAETVESIAEMVGYQDVSAFYRAFTLYYGMAPRKINP